MSRSVFDECCSYFQTKKGLENDFYFPGQLLEKLTSEERQNIEKKIITSCLNGDRRFFDAVAFCDPELLKQCFTGSSMQRISDSAKRASLLSVLYTRTLLPDYLLNLIRIAPSDSAALYRISRLFEDNSAEGEKWLSDEYRLISRAYKTILTIKGSAGRNAGTAFINAVSRKEYRRIGLLEPSEIDRLLELNEWRFPNDDEHLLFFRALAWSNEYAGSHDPDALNRIIEHSLLHPEVYDILDCMIKQGILSKDTVSQLIAQNRREPSALSSDWQSVIRNSRTYKKELRRIMLRSALVSYSPETVLPFAPSIRELCMLEWGTADAYGQYVGSFIDSSHSELLDIKDYSCWDYNQCLAYLIYLQRLSHWDDGPDYFYEQVINGSVRKVLLRMIDLTQKHRG